MWRDACWALTPLGRSGQAPCWKAERRALLSEGDAGTKPPSLGQAGWGVGGLASLGQPPDLAGPLPPDWVGPGWLVWAGWLIWPGGSRSSCWA